jgi:hypothetical protein
MSSLPKIMPTECYKEWEYNYPTSCGETNTYSSRIKDYRKLTREDKRVLVNDVLEFQRYCFWWLNLPVPTLDQMFFLEYLEPTVHGLDDRMGEAQRGLAKSLDSQILVSWMFLRNKDEVICVISATGRRAESWTLFVLNMIRNIPLLKHLKPSSDDRTSGSKFDIAGRTPNDSPSCAAFGVTSAKTGSRATYLIYDDIEILENSDTAQKREKLEAGAMDAANLGIANVYRSAILCTPQSSESVYNGMIEKGYARCIVPSEYPEDIDNYEGDLAPHIVKALEDNPELVGRNTDIRLDMEHLNKQKLKVGKSQYKLQYMLDTTLTDAEKYPLKLADLIVMDLDREVAPMYIEYSSEKKNALWDLKHHGFRGDGYFQAGYYSADKRERYTGIMMAIDPSGRGKDETTYSISATLGGKIFLLDFGGFKGGYEREVLVSLCELARDYKINHMLIEDNFGDGMFAELIKPVLTEIYVSEDGNGDGCKVEDIKATTNKEMRIIETLEPVMNSHRLVINKQTLKKDYEKSKVDYKFSHQLTHITKQKNCLGHDDVVDVVELSVRYWKDNMARNEAATLKEHEEKLKKEKLDAFIAKYGGKTSRGNNVMDNY